MTWSSIFKNASLNFSEAVLQVMESLSFTEISSNCVPHQFNDCNLEKQYICVSRILLQSKYPILFFKGKVNYRTNKDDKSSTMITCKTCVTPKKKEIQHFDKGKFQCNLVTFLIFIHALLKTSSLVRKKKVYLRRHF